MDDFNQVKDMISPILLEEQKEAISDAENEMVG